MKVDVFSLTLPDASTAPLPRAWRVSTPEGVFWVLEEGPTARLLQLPLPFDTADDGETSGSDLSARGAALALEAETEAASRWVRQGVAGRTREPAASDWPG